MKIRRLWARSGCCHSFDSTFYGWRLPWRTDAKTRRASSSRMKYELIVAAETKVTTTKKKVREFLNMVSAVFVARTHEAAESCAPKEYYEINLHCCGAATAATAAARQCNASAVYRRTRYAFFFSFGVWLRRRLARMCENERVRGWWREKLLTNWKFIN